MHFNKAEARDLPPAPVLAWEDWATFDITVVRAAEVLMEQLMRIDGKFRRFLFSTMFTTNNLSSAPVLAGKTKDMQNFLQKTVQIFYMPKEGEGEEKSLPYPTLTAYAPLSLTLGT